jgi:tetratricopeptide (TPR) repeat protein
VVAAASRCAWTIGLIKITLGDDWVDVEPYLDQALELSGTERDAYVDRVALEQPGIAAALRDLLADRDELDSKGFLEEPVMALTDISLVGQQVGAYTIDSLIGRGGMGEVWLALRSDGRFEGKFAIKFLDSYTTSPLALDRFRREGRLLARLSHPHIARLIDAGVTSAGRPYLVLEYIDGERIDGYCGSHSLGIEARVRLLLDVLSALAHAHSNLVVHRDLKPSNVLVTRQGVAKLLDFGIGKLLHADTDGDGGSTSTRVEDSALTPEYAAPEQFLGEPASTATDVYQVGVLMFVLLAGRLPLATPGTTRAERIKAALDSEPLRLSAAASPDARTVLRGDLDAIVSKALRKRPQERYATAAALADDLKRYLGNEPVAARANLLGYRMRKFVRRYRGAVIGTSAAISALIAATAFALFQMREAQIQRDLSRAQAKRAEVQAEFVTLMMSTVGDKPATSEQLLDAGRQLLDRHYGNDPRFRATAMLNLSARYAELGLTTKAHAVGENADALARQLNDPMLIAGSQCALGESELDLGHTDTAVARVAAGRAALLSVPNADPRIVADCAVAEADLTDAQGNPRAATQIAEKALALLERIGETHDVRYPSLLSRISDFYKAAGDTHRGFEFGERSLAAFENNGLGDTDQSMMAMHNMASSLSGVGEAKAACAREQQVISRLQAAGRTIITAMAVFQGSCLLRAGDTDLALSWFDKGLKAAQDENDASLQMYARVFRARALIELKRFDGAATELDGVAALSKQNVAKGGIFAARGQIVRAQLLLAQGRPEDAQHTLDPMLPELREPNGPQRTLLPGALTASVKIAMAQKRYPEAIELANELLQEQVRRARNPAMSAEVGEASLLLALAKQAIGDQNGMHEAARRAVISLTAGLGADNARTRDAMNLQ